MDLNNPSLKAGLFEDIEVLLPSNLKYFDYGNAINALRNAPFLKIPAFENHSSLTGIFNLSKAEKIIIALEGNQLMFAGKGPRKLPLLRQTENSFTIGRTRTNCILSGC